MGDGKSSGCGTAIAAIIMSIIAALAAAYAKSPCGVYRALNNMKLGHADPPRKFVGSNVTFGNCTAAQQASIKSWMEKGYDRLVAGCWKSLNLPGVDTKTKEKIRNRMVDYLTCEPLQVVCGAAHCDQDKSSCGFFETSDYYATPKRVNLCPSNCTGDLTPTIVHEIAHLSEFDVRGWTYETTAVPFGASCS
jgi:hypothetical protein